MQETPLGNFLRQHRVKMNYSQKAFASLVGVSESYLSRIENGTSSPRSGALLKKLSEALKIYAGCHCVAIFRSSNFTAHSSVARWTMLSRVFDCPFICTINFSFARRRFFTN
ncbi:helix-turn-helix domain-containing protein [Undibacterium sp. JH2W]|uniref:helix-turn-helix domain-containing protein n=1 Tax=Undibacterium sp. JH2W TaxID=3413037 RepID=UPI003BEF939C